MEEPPKKTSQESPFDKNGRIGEAQVLIGKIMAMGNNDFELTPIKRVRDKISEQEEVTEEDIVNLKRTFESKQER